MAAAAFVAPAFGAAATPPVAHTAPAPASAAPGQLLDEIVAVVNDQPILESALTAEEAQVGAALQTQGTPLPPENVFRHQVLEHLITQQIQLQAAKNQGIQISADQINQALSAIAARNNLTLAQLPQALAAQGQSYLSFRHKIENQLIMHQLVQQAVAANIEVSPAEVANYLQREANAAGGNIEYQLAQILVTFPTNATPAEVKKTLAKAEGIEAKIKDGADFAATAVAESGGPHALQGGMIGWLKAADMPTLFTDVVPTMKVSEVSAPIAGVGGYHIVKLVATRQPKSENMQTEYHVEHIMLKPNPVRDLAQSKTLAEKLRGEIESGKTSFAAAAKQYSDDPNSAGNGGDLGWQTPDQMPKSFGAALANLKPNTLSQPVQSDFGWHLIEILGERKTDATQTEREHQAYQAIFQRKLADQLAEFNRVLRDQTYVHILNPADAGDDTTADAGAKGEG
ncbi:MAG: peptidylprolyl isomerase [Gammaproteobacteria bacterium]